jgi:hypothetical protein
MNPANDHLVNPVLHTIGFDLERGLAYNVALHRSWDKQVGVGLIISGECRTDRLFQLSEWCTAEDRQIGQGDLSLAEHLASMERSQTNYSEGNELEEDKEAYLEQDEIEAIEDEIMNMSMVLRAVRGDQYRRDGSLKRPQDYHQEEAVDRKRKKWTKRSNAKREQI